MIKKILITGGAGYIGSHTAVELIQAGYHVVILDNISNSSIKVLDRVKKIAGNELTFIQADVCQVKMLDQIFSQNEIYSVMHFAGLKIISESVANPIRYFANNVGSTLGLLQAMNRANVKRIVFSSSATVYGDPERVPIAESSLLQTVNPYSRTKLMCEEILRDLCSSDPSWAAAILRYFNPIGAHISGSLGDNSFSSINNLMPIITQVAVGKRDDLKIYGNDYPTPDGTCIRDYIHIVDLARGHLAALNYLHENNRSITVNLGAGRGVSVKELVDTFVKVTGVSVPYQFVARRIGDVATSYADISLAQKTLGWKAELNLERMCTDAWRWQIKNPDGY